jgi:hypothetical protein
VTGRTIVRREAPNGREITRMTIKIEFRELERLETTIVCRAEGTCG